MWQLSCDTAIIHYGKSNVMILLFPMVKPRRNYTWQEDSSAKEIFEQVTEGLESNEKCGLPGTLQL